MDLKKLVNKAKKAGAFTLGMFIGTCYGSTVSTMISYIILKDQAIQVHPVFATVDEMSVLLEELQDCEDELGRHYGNMR